jgi:hypothetical protein
VISAANRDGISFRLAEEGDRETMEGFTCSRGARCEDSVQDYVRADALLNFLAPKSRLQLFVFLRDEELIGVAGHNPELLVTEDETPNKFRVRTATRLHVVALELAHQETLVDGSRLSDLVMTTLIHEAIDGRAEALLTGIVHRDNDRSLAMCWRHGLRSQVEFDVDHLRVSGWLTLTS